MCPRPRCRALPRTYSFAGTSRTPPCCLKPRACSATRACGPLWQPSGTQSRSSAYPWGVIRTTTLSASRHSVPAGHLLPTRAPAKFATPSPRFSDILLSQRRPGSTRNDRGLRRRGRCGGRARVVPASLRVKTRVRLNELTSHVPTVAPPTRSGSPPCLSSSSCSPGECGSAGVGAGIEARLRERIETGEIAEIGDRLT